MAIYDSHNNGSGPGLGSRVDHLNDGAQKLIAEARSAVSDLSSSVDLTMAWSPPRWGLATCWGAAFSPP